MLEPPERVLKHPTHLALSVMVWFVGWGRKVRQGRMRLDVVG